MLPKKKIEGEEGGPTAVADSEPQGDVALSAKEEMEGVTDMKTDVGATPEDVPVNGEALSTAEGVEEGGNPDVPVPMEQ